MTGTTHEIKLSHRILSHAPGIGRYTAGANPLDGVRKALELSKKGFSSICNVLGEHDTDDRIIQRSITEYEMVIDGLSEHKNELVRPSISLKPTQFGFYCEKDRCDNVIVEHRLDKIIERATTKGLFVWIDMENHTTTDFTIHLYRKTSKQYGDKNVGVVLQANLFRTEKDLEGLLELSKTQTVHVRLVKGIYAEGPEIAFTSKENAHANLAKLINTAFEKGERIKVSLGSHHPLQIARTVKHAQKTPEKFHDFEFLHGAARKIPEYLLSLGFKCAYYVPAGPRFFAYGMRRIRENPNTVFGLLFSPIYENKNLEVLKKELERKNEN